MPDDHEYIIKMPDNGDPIPEYGVGFEIFHKMKLRENEIAQYHPETDESVTFGELLDSSIRVAINLKKFNLSGDSIIAVCSESHKHTCVPYIAALFNGNIVTFSDPLLPPKSNATIYKKAPPSVLFVDEDLLDKTEQSLKLSGTDTKLIVFGKNTAGHMSFEELLGATEEEIQSFQPAKVNNDRTAALFFSSGTTGLPKGICVPHVGLLAKTGGFTFPVVLVLSAPNWISYTLLLVRSLREGGARVLGKKIDLSQIWRLVHKYKINMILPSVFQCSQMIKYPIDKDLNLSSLNLVVAGGSLLPPEIFARLKKVLPNVFVIQPYGLTEASGPILGFDLSRADHRELHKKNPDSCGLPIIGVWYKVVDPETEEILGPNKQGELRVKSRYSMKSYYKEDASSDFDSDGYFKTGDIVRYDEDGCFYIVDRIKEMLKYRAHMWSPVQVENALISHPSVEIAAVVGVPHPTDGHIPMGFVKLRSENEVTPEELVEYADKTLKDDRKRLRAGVKIVKDFPVNAAGKILKRKLLDMVAAGEI